MISLLAGLIWLVWFVRAGRRNLAFLLVIPFLGWHMRRAGHIAVNRASTGEAVEALRRAAREVRPGVSVFLYPEGTRSRDGALQPFKKGGFKFAIQTGLPVVPVTISGTRALLPRDSVIFRHGPVDLHVGRPIPTAGLTDEDVPALMQRVREAMTEHMKKP